MALNPQYISLGYLENYFVNKDNGNPLANGKVFFYRDTERTIFKDIYKLNGSPAAYQYAALPNPCTLSSFGTFVDVDGNNISPYAYPYDDTGSLDLYYIVVTDSNGVVQFTRQAVPEDIAALENNNIDTVVNDINYIKNGQFLTINTGMPYNEGRCMYDNSSIDSIFKGTIYESNCVYSIAGSIFNRRAGDCFIIKSSFSPDYDVLAIYNSSIYPTAGIDSLEANPYYYLSYEMGTDVPVTFNMLCYIVDNVEFCASKKLTISAAISSTASGVSIQANVIQLYKRSDGFNKIKESRSIGVVVDATITEHSFVVDVADLDIAYLEPKNGGFLIVAFVLPINVLTNIKITNLECNIGEKALPYPIITKNDSSIDIKSLPDFSTFTMPDYNDSLYYKPDGIIAAYNRVLSSSVSWGITDAYPNGITDMSTTMSWISSLPTGASIKWYGFARNPSSVQQAIPREFLLLDNLECPAYKFSNLYLCFRLSTTNYTTIYGLGDGFVTTTVNDNSVSVQATSTGNPTVAPTASPSFAISNFNAGGGSGDPARFTITCSPAINIGLADFINVVALGTKTYTIYFIIDGVMHSSLYGKIFDRRSIFAYIKSSYTASQVATVISQVFYPLTFKLPQGVDSGSWAGEIIRI